MKHQLKSKVALITGCDQGIGLSICKRFAEEGATVYANVLKQTSAEKVMATCSDAEGNVCPVCFDITEKEKITECIKLIRKEQNGRLDILVNNAGYKKDSVLGMIDDAGIARMLDVNVVAAIHMTQAAIRLMRRNPAGGGAVVNLASIVGLRGNNGQSVYGATKGAVASMTKSWAKELAAANIRVNAVAPGSIDTDMFYAMSEDMIKQSIDAIGMKRLGKPEEVANVVLFLASDLSSYITGEIVGVDGGLFM